MINFFTDLLNLKDMWRTEQLFGLCFLSLFLIPWIVKRSGILPAICLVYLWLSAMWVFNNPVFIFGKFQRLFIESSARAFAAAVIVPLVVLVVSNKALFRMVLFLEFLVIVDSILVLMYGIGIFNNNAADGTFIAMMLPTMWLRPTYLTSDLAPEDMNITQSVIVTLYTITPAMALVACRQSSTVVALLAALIFVYFLLERKRIRALLFGVSIALIGAFSVGSEQILNSNGRTQIWKAAMSWWAKEANVWFGVGTGTFEWAGPLLLHRTDSKVFLWMHNEYLQILFEQGIIGFFLLALLTFAVVNKLKNRRWLQLSAIAFLIASMTQFPFRFVFTQMWAAILVRLAYTQEDDLWLKS